MYVYVYINPMVLAQPLQQFTSVAFPLNLRHEQMTAVICSFGLRGLAQERSGWSQCGRAQGAQICQTCSSASVPPTSMPF